MNRLIAGVIAVALPLAAAAAPERYTADPFHTFPHFEVNHLGFSNLRGRFDKTAATFTIDRAAKTASIEITVQTASISSGFRDVVPPFKLSRDDLIRSPDLFNATEFPTMSYKSTAVRFNGDNPATVEGNLTLLGVTKPLTFHIENWKCGPNPFNKKEMCGGNASGAFNRSDFGMKWGLPVGIGDQVKVWIEIEAYKN